ncbi:zinc-binding dehydrogenase, partial [Bacillus sp. SIMBA_161]
AVQLAKIFGAEVTAVCSGKNIELVKSLGADYAIDYTLEDFTDSTKSYDLIFDTVGKTSFAKCKRVMTEKGIYLATVAGVPQFAQMITT